MHVGTVPCRVIIHKVNVIFEEGAEKATTFSVHLALQLPSGDLYPLSNEDQPLSLEDDQVPEEIAEDLLRIITERVKSLFGEDMAPSDVTQDRTLPSDVGFTHLSGGTFTLED